MSSVEIPKCEIIALPGNFPDQSTPQHMRKSSPTRQSITPTNDNLPSNIDINVNDIQQNALIAQKSSNAEIQLKIRKTMRRKRRQKRKNPDIPKCSPTSRIPISRLARYGQNDSSVLCCEDESCFGKLKWFQVDSGAAEKFKQCNSVLKLPT